MAHLIQERNNLQNRPNPPFRNQSSTPPPLQHSNTTTTISPTADLLGPNALSLFNQQSLFDSFVFKWQEKIIFIAFTTRFNTSFCLSLTAIFKEQNVNWLFLAFLFNSWDPGGFVILSQP